MSFRYRGSLSVYDCYFYAVLVLPFIRANYILFMLNIFRFKYTMLMSIRNVKPLSCPPSGPTFKSNIRDNPTSTVGVVCAAFLISAYISTRYNQSHLVSRFKRLICLLNRGDGISICRLRHF